MPKRGKVYIDEEWCKGCDVCAAFCPKNVLELGDDGKMKVVNPENCIACNMCVLLCPDYAVEVEVVEDNE